MAKKTTKLSLRFRSVALPSETRPKRLLRESEIHLYNYLDKQEEVISLEIALNMKEYKNYVENFVRPLVSDFEALGLFHFSQFEAANDLHRSNKCSQVMMKFLFLREELKLLKQVKAELTGGMSPEDLSLSLSGYLPKKMKGLEVETTEAFTLWAKGHMPGFQEELTCLACWEKKSPFMVGSIMSPCCFQYFYCTSCVRRQKLLLDDIFRCKCNPKRVVQVMAKYKKEKINLLNKFKKYKFLNKILS
jgi:hypothetical protein